MKYLVMECHAGYCILLDESGRFIKTANLGYEVGQTLDRAIELEIPESANRVSKIGAGSELRIQQIRRIVRRTLIIAVALVALIGNHHVRRTPIGRVRMQINPDILLTVNRYERIVESEGLNLDGDRLLDEYDVKGKKLDRALKELAARAIESGYLDEDGGDIMLTVYSEDEKWKHEVEKLLGARLDHYLIGKITVSTSGEDIDRDDDDSCERDDDDDDD